MTDNTKEQLHNLEKLGEDYSMSALDVYNILISKNDEDFPLSFETLKYKALKDITCDILKQIFTLEELESIFSNTKMRRIKNEETKIFIQTFN